MEKGNKIINFSTFNNKQIIDRHDKIPILGIDFRENFVTVICPLRNNRLFCL